MTFERGAALLGLVAIAIAQPVFEVVSNSPEWLRAASDVAITLRNPRQFDNVKLASDPLPLYVHGALTTSRADPLNVAVVVNGTVAAVAQSYQDRDGHMFGTLIPETLLRDGRNTASAFVLSAYQSR